MFEIGQRVYLKASPTCIAHVMGVPINPLGSEERELLVPIMLTDPISVGQPRITIRHLLLPAHELAIIE